MPVRERKAEFVLKQAEQLLEHKISCYDQLFSKAATLLTVEMTFISGAVGFAVASVKPAAGICAQPLPVYFAILYALLLARSLIPLYSAIKPRNIYGTGDRPASLLVPKVYRFTLEKIIRAEAKNYEKRIEENSTAVAETSEDFIRALKRFAWAPFLVLGLFLVALALVRFDLWDGWQAIRLPEWCALAR